ncbi:hypothetical protein HYW46_00090 [Candidatus Daviesbacteria bacterium]|nr:hypothetical protein [Candidatus Daviesbacteria bacterium]
MKGFSARTKSAGFVASPPLVIGGVIAVIIIILIASGSLKFSGYVKVDDSKKPQGDQTVTQTEKPAPTDTPKPAVKLNSESYSDTKYGFSISYPEGWKVKEQTNNVNFFKPSATKGGDQADALVSVVADDLKDNRDMKLATIADLHKTFLKKQFSNAEVTAEKEIKIGELDGYELEFTGMIGSDKMQGRYIVIKGEKYLVALIGMANMEFWDSEKANIDASIQTFKL